MVDDYDEAQEVTQVAFVKAFEKLSSYRPEHKFFSWLYRIAMNEALNYLNRVKRQRPIDSQITSPAPNPAEVYESSWVDGQVQNALGELSIDYRAIVVLRHFADLSMRDLAYIFEIPIKTVKSRLYTARRKLCEILRRRGVRPND
jgi:RNA polymerase sigma-70 factor (ECF subfamily)